jgi:hypothetical protein
LHFFAQQKVVHEFEHAVDTFTALGNFDYGADVGALLFDNLDRFLAFLTKLEIERFIIDLNNRSRSTDR